ncbi:hypothetical protein BDV28DRAFT_104979 [Aspergillus coremiiformis]|uniref:Uncharacterized protein n=1 Tax=Aspergillus coremiiformis TaxID=138285 RepID=A0A5N6Z7E2_9EURO|nr:hypothetical protein BDV28DRAFT_104979 [Aspergillus coremiiformis]
MHAMINGQRTDLKPHLRKVGHESDPGTSGSLVKNPDPSPAPWLALAPISKRDSPNQNLILPHRIPAHTD